MQSEPKTYCTDLCEMYGINDIMTKKGMHIDHLNIRSIVNKWDVFKSQFMRSNFHILGLSETWLHDHLPSSTYNLSCDFDMIRLDRNWYEPGSSTFIKNSLQYSDFDYKHLSNISSKDIEARWLRIKQTNSKDVLLCNLYRPPPPTPKVISVFILIILKIVSLLLT